MPEIVNVEQAAEWDGAQGDIWVEREERQNAAFRAHTEQLFAAAAVEANDRVLDIGCGCGETTRECGRLAVDGDALGIDLSTAMLARARKRAAGEGLTNVVFQRGDAQVQAFAPATRSLAVSRFGVMFFADPVAAFTNIAGAMAPGGRVAFMVWQALDRNEWLTETRGALAVGRAVPEPPADVPGAFGLADPQRSRTILERAGFTRVEIDAVEVPFRFGADADEAWDFVQGIRIVRGLLEDIDADTEARALDALRATMQARETADGVVFDSRAWMVRGVR
jgi:SAM-dependent methyltransferase